MLGRGFSENIDILVYYLSSWLSVGVLGLLTVSVCFAEEESDK